MDSVTERIEGAITKAKNTLGWLQGKLAEKKKGVFDSAGNVRSAISLECAQRQIEVDAAKERVKDLETALTIAREDEPRRDAARKQAADLEAQAVLVDKEVVQLAEKMRKAEQEASKLRSQAQAALYQASATKDELKRREENRKADEDQKAKEELAQNQRSLEYVKKQIANGRELTPEKVAELEDELTRLLELVGTNGN